MEKHAAGLIIRKSGASYSEIAKTLGVSPNTVTTWSRKYEWEQKVMEDQLFQETATEQIREMIQYQLKILNAIKDKKMEQIGNLDKADLSELNTALISKGDIDALQKLFTTIRGKEISWEQVVRIVREFTEYLENEAYKLAEKITPHAQHFLDQKRKGGVA